MIAFEELCKILRKTPRQLAKLSRNEIYYLIMDAWHSDRLALERHDFHGNPMNVTHTQWRQYCYQNFPRFGLAAGEPGHPTN